MKYKFIIVWFNRNNKEYYFKKVKGTYIKYYVGYVNQYNHEVLLVIDIQDFYSNNKLPLKTKIIDRLIGLLNKLK